MFRYEWKKLFRYRKGWILTILFLIAEFISIFLFTKPYDSELEAAREVYDSYLSHVEGPLTSESRQWLEDEMARLSAANLSMEQLKNRFYQGSIDEEAYRESFEPLAAECADYPGFSKLYTQYIYVRESDSRAFLYTGGWEVLFGNQEPDYLFLMLLIFLLSPIFCQEYSSQMDPILLTQKSSSKHLWWIKVATALLFTAAITVILQLSELIFCALRFGLPHWDYTLESLYSFGTSRKGLNLGQAFFLQFGLKLLGYQYAALLILCISVLVKKYALTLMAAIVILPLPFLTVSSLSGLRSIPAPWALTIGSIYLNGSGVELIHGQAAAIAETGWAELGFVVASSFLICGSMLFCIRYRNTNRLLQKKGKILAVTSLTALLFLTGCSPQVENPYYNSGQANAVSSGDLVILSNNVRGICIDTETGTLWNFPLDAFSGETICVQGSFFCQSGKLFYIKLYCQAPSGGSGYRDELYELTELDLATMEERSVFQWDQSRDWFFGLLPREPLESTPFGFVNFFLHENAMYYGINGELFRMDLQTGIADSYMKLPNAGCNFAYDGTTLYFTDSYNRLSLHNFQTGETTALDQIVARDFRYTPEGIYYLNIRDDCTLYFWDFSDDAAKKLDDTSAYSIDWDPQYCWLSTYDGFFRLNHDGTEKTMLNCPGSFLYVPQGDLFFTLDFETAVLYCVDKKTLECTGSYSSSGFLE